MEKLKPCPFCGSTDIEVCEDFGYFIGCDTRDCRGNFSLCERQETGYYHSRKEAVAAWNRRADTARKTVMRLAVADGIPYKDEDYDYAFICENCGYKTLGLPRYCPDCGCLVDAEASDKIPSTEV